MLSNWRLNLQPSTRKNWNERGANNANELRMLCYGVLWYAIACGHSQNSIFFLLYKRRITRRFWKILSLCNPKEGKFSLAKPGSLFHPLLTNYARKTLWWWQMVFDILRVLFRMDFWCFWKYAQSASCINLSPFSSVAIALQYWIFVQLFSGHLVASIVIKTCCREIIAPKK